MRIVSGSARGTRLATFTGGSIRPTPDRVREAVFSMLNSRLGGLQGKRVLDLFAGTGAMALEALSRGADQAWLVDSGEQSRQLIPRNQQTCKLQGKAVFLPAALPEALVRLKKDGPFDLIFLDPPYGMNLVPVTLLAIERHGLLRESGLLLAETAVEDGVPERMGRYRRCQQRRYGSTVIHLFSCDETETSPL